jgi:predicted membrane protein
MRMTYKYLKAMTLMTNLRLQMVLTMKWLIVMMRLMIRLAQTHIKIIFNQCNAIFYLFHICFKIHFLSVLICLLLIAGCWTKMVGDGMRTRRGRRSMCRTKEEAQQDGDPQ